MMKEGNGVGLLRRIAWSSLAAAFLGLAGCNTVQGFGEDLQHLGHSISNKANQ